MIFLYYMLFITLPKFFCVFFCKTQAITNFMQDSEEVELTPLDLKIERTFKQFKKEQKIARNIVEN